MRDSTADNSFAEAPEQHGLVGLFEQHRNELRRFLAARCANPSDAEDLMQDLWVKLATLRPGPIANGKAYLFRTANNMVLDRARTALRAAARDGRWVQEELGGASIEARVDPALPNDEALAMMQEQALLQHAIAQLPNGAQKALRLYRFDGLSQSEVAVVMGISRSAVEKHLAVAMKHLRRIVSNWGAGGSAASNAQDDERDEGSQRGERR